MWRLHIPKDNTSTNYAAYIFNITKAAKNWYENGVNNGIMLASSNESISKRTRFFSSDCGQSEAAFPTVLVSYVNNTGIEDYWTYQTVDMGRSGVAYIGDYNGSFTYIHNDVSTAGGRMPAGVSHVYSNDRTYFDGVYGNMKIGKGFRLSILEKVELLSSSSSLYSAGYRIKYIDGDGTVHYFKAIENVSNKYAHEFNDKLTVSKLSSGKFEMVDDSNNKKEFNSNGYLISITDCNSNTTTITYNSAGDQITKLTDGAGKEITFTYDDGYLTGITDPAGRTTNFIFSKNSDGSTSDYLRSIQYPDGKLTTFYYQCAYGRLSQIVCHDTSDVLFTLKSVTSVSKTFYRIATVERRSELSSGARTTQNKLTYTYGSGETKITDNFGKASYIYFDNAGRTVNVRDHAGNASYAKYNSSGNTANTLALQSGTLASVNNLAKNHSAEFTIDSEWYQQTAWSGQGTATVSADQYYLGYKSFKVTSTGTAGRVNYCQAFTGAPGQTYTLSAYVKLLEDMGSGTGGASLAFCYEDANGNWQTVHGDYITTAQDWSRESYTFTLPSNATGSMGIQLAIFDRAGTAYFDGVQLEVGSAMNRYNLLDNSGFDYGNYHWSNEANTSVDGAVSAGIDGKGMRIYGTPTGRKNIYQAAQINGSAGQTVVYGGWAKANSTGAANTSNSTAIFKLTLGVYYTDGTVAWPTETFNPDVSQAQYICSSYTLQKECKYIRVYFTYYYNVNSATFDNACLYIDNFGSKYEYNSDGRITSVTDGTGQGISYTYDGPDVTKISQKFDGVEKESCTYTYDDNHNVLTETTKGGVTTEYQYTPQEGTTSTYGNPTKVLVKNADGTLQSSCEMVYTDDYDYLMWVIDSRDGLTSYGYNTLTGTLQWVDDANGATTTYTYDENTDALLSTSCGGNYSAPATTGYTYSKDRLASITHNGFNYGFSYDSFGRVTSTTVADRTLISHTYNANGTLATSTYGNGATVSYVYDDLDRVVSTSYNNVKAYEYDYNKEGYVTRQKDNVLNLTTNYEYDLANRLSATVSSNGLKAAYTYDERNNIKELDVTKGGQTLADNSYTYKTDGLIESVAMPLLGNSTLNYTHDGLNRTTNKTVTGSQSAQFSTDYTYLANGTNQTGLVSKLDNKVTVDGTTTTIGSFEYTYDANGNITQIKQDGELVVTYRYDEFGQLCDEVYVATGIAHYYWYDRGGNITDYCVVNIANNNNELLDYIYYTYDATWKDLLTSYNGKAITYDAIGNPLTYDGYSYTWQNGRQLAAISGNGVNLSFAYNSDGLRARKVSGTTTTQFYYSGSLLLAQHDGTNWLKFVYSADGDLIGFTYNGTPYYYVKNLQGDVVGILDANMNTVVEYAYNAWGKLLSVSGTMVDTIGQINPIRYRGYYYDIETRLYYVSSRYYDPEIGRWINADNMITTGSDLTGLNLFAYCGNNPVNRVDPSGQFWISAIIKAAVVVVAVVAVVAKVVCTVKETKRVQKELDSLPEPTADITESFRETLKTNANTVKETTKNEGIIESGKQFYNKVRNKGEWDLKQLPEYQGTFQFNDLVIQGQDIGNINFGYTGKALGLPDSVLLAGAGFAQIKAGTSNFSFIMASNGDDLRDQMYIMYGIMLYNEDH